MKKTDGVVSVTEYLTDTTGTTDNAQQLRDAVATSKANKKKLHVPRWVTVRVDSTVDMTGVDLDIQGVIKSYVDHAPAIIIGGDSRNSIPTNAHINWVLKGNTLNTDDIGVRVVGVKNGKITVMLDYYTQLWTDENTVGRTSISYSEFWFGKIDTLELFGEPGLSWITDCNFYGGRYQKILIGTENGTYPHNNNVFYKPCVEGGIIHIKRGVRNIFRDVRSEAGTKYYFEADSHRNIIFDNYIAGYSFIDGGGYLEYDQGFENFVVSSIEPFYKRYTLASLDEKTKFRNGVCEWNIKNKTAFTKTDDIYTPSAWKELFTVDIDLDYVRRIGFKADSSIFRFNIHLYDDQGTLLDDPNGVSTAGYSYEPTEKKFYYSANVAQGEFGLISKTAKTAKTATATLTFGGSLSGLTFKNLHFFVGGKREKNQYVENLVESLRTQKFDQLTEIGSTRPSSPLLGEPFIDTTINKAIWWNGTAWIDATGATI
ncbi:hypothetical protein JMM81_12350 [Bacillus sp. V3B]|uniref:hypothetical protein n=1 Tax=Bacillus sp. V3B TaxID=2804915 RepID=UPI00210C066E|nr:hypothetical protein [Bacillus sp. V3B]MCQ6275747.1 hypothetical protein [Bacillus sp. V3B]